jgi:RNA polymerase sigma factor (sigma-70 family)
MACASGTTCSLAPAPATRMPRQFYDKHCDGIRRIVRFHLQKRFGARIDVEDLVQSTFRVLFTDPSIQEHFSSPDALVAFVSAVAHNKVLKAQRQLEAQKRDVGREKPLPADLPDAQPTAEQIIADIEECEALEGSLPPPIRGMLRLLREGHTVREIADRIGISDRALYRCLAKLRRQPGTPAA